MIRARKSLEVSTAPLCSKSDIYICYQNNHGSMKANSNSNRRSQTALLRHTAYGLIDALNFRTCQFMKSRVGIEPKFEWVMNPPKRLSNEVSC